jgi:hypothetical protein
MHQLTTGCPLFRGNSRARHCTGFLHHRKAGQIVRSVLSALLRFTWNCKRLCRTQIQLKQHPALDTESRILLGLPRDRVRLMSHSKADIFAPLNPARMVDRYHNPSRDRYRDNPPAISRPRRRVLLLLLPVPGQAFSFRYRLRCGRRYQKIQTPVFH